jgi:hypothetical protein
MLYCASIRSAGSRILWRSIIRGVAGDGDRLDIGAAEAVLGLQIAHRFDRGMRGDVAGR